MEWMGMKNTSPRGLIRESSVPDGGPVWIKDQPPRSRRPRLFRPTSDVDDPQHGPGRQCYANVDLREI